MKRVRSFRQATTNSGNREPGAMISFSSIVPGLLACPLDGHEEQDYSKCTILVADDEDSVLSAVESSLKRRLGCAVATVRDGDEALAYLDAHDVDVLLTDMLMPGVHGLELLRIVHERWPETDTIVMTGYSKEFPYVEVVSAGARDFISKPCPNAELEAKVRRIFWERGLRKAQVFAEAKYRGIFELNMDGILLLDSDTLEVMDVNAAFCDVSGFKTADLIGKPVTGLLDPDTRERFLEGLQVFAVRGKGALADIALIRTDERMIYLDVSLTFVDVADKRIVCVVVRDITEKRDIEERLAQVARKDHLTGLWNKRAFDARLESAVGRAAGDGSPLCLLFIDVDNFKGCNDTHGHQIGDELLGAVGSIILESTRAGCDEGFRYGGDEFAVLLCGASVEVAARAGERIRKTFESVENYGTSLSIGAARLKDNSDAATLVRDADGALYKAKASGKNALCMA